MLRKSTILLTVVILALTVDGALTCDMFEIKIGPFSKWLGLILILGIIGAIYWAETSNKRDN